MKLHYLLFCRGFSDFLHYEADRDISIFLDVLQIPLGNQTSIVTSSWPSGQPFWLLYFEGLKKVLHISESLTGCPGNLWRYKSRSSTPLHFLSSRPLLNIWNNDLITLKGNEDCCISLYHVKQWCFLKFCFTDIKQVSGEWGFS